MDIYNNCIIQMYVICILTTGGGNTIRISRNVASMEAASVDTSHAKRVLPIEGGGGPKAPPHSPLRCVRACGRVGVRAGVRACVRACARTLSDFPEGRHNLLNQCRPPLFSCVELLRKTSLTY